MMKVPYRDLRVTDEHLKQELIEAVESVLNHGHLLLGPEVNEFEDLISGYCHRKYAVGVGTGTQAIYLALRALGIGVGDDVITTPMSWIATVNAIVLAGANPVFVDIQDDLNINANLVRDAITSRTKAIMPVHYTGRICNMQSIMSIANEFDLFVIEDAAQSFGARLNGKPAGSFGNIGCFSMNTMKLFSSYGEAGALVFDDSQLYETLLSLRYQGTVERENCHETSLNARIDTIQAAMMLCSYRHLEKKIESFRCHAARYNLALGDCVTCPPEDNSYQTYYTYTIKTPKRDDLLKYLIEHGIEAKIYHPILMPYHNAYKNRFIDLNIPVAEKLVKEILSIPNHDQLTETQIDYVISVIQKFFKKY